MGIAAKILFTNEIDSSSYSAETTTPPAMQTIPADPTVAPSNVVAVTSGTTMGVSMTALTGTDTGGVALSSYHLVYSTSTSGPWTEVAGESSNSTTLEHS